MYDEMERVSGMRLMKDLVLKGNAIRKAAGENGDEFKAF